MEEPEGNDIPLLNCRRKFHSGNRGQFSLCTTYASLWLTLIRTCSWIAKEVIEIVNVRFLLTRNAFNHACTHWQVFSIHWEKYWPKTPYFYLDLNYLLNFYCYSVTIICLFSPSLHPTPAKPTSLLHLHPPPWFCPCVLYSSSCNPLSSLSSPHSSLPIVTLFLTSMSLVIFCFLLSSIDYVPVKGEIIWYLSLTAWLISLSIF